MNHAVTVSALGKRYSIYPSAKARLREWLSFGKHTLHSEHWVFRNLSFDVAKGEAVGLIGVNGAGKSTLLKVLAGTITPTEGSYQVNGRVAALLELGMGFHPDFNGWQNAMNSGQLLGFSQDEMRSMMDDIVAFAELGDAMEQPIRTWSSGMQMRLAFSVATARRPDILIVDEALSVGDAYFQHKSFARIHEFKQQGSAMFIVSHDFSAIQKLCDRALLLNGGELAFSGDPESAINYYSALIAEKEQQTVRKEALADGRIRVTSGTGEVSIERAQIINSKGEATDVVTVGEQVTLEITAKIHQPVPALVFGFMLRDRLGQWVYGINTHRLDQPLEAPQVGDTITWRYQFNANLGAGNYSIGISLSGADSHLVANYEWRDLAILFSVVNTQQENFLGLCWLPGTSILSNNKPE